MSIHDGGASDSRKYRSDRVAGSGVAFMVYNNNAVQKSVKKCRATNARSSSCSSRIRSWPVASVGERER